MNLRILCAAVSAAFSLLAPGVAPAQDVTLTARDGGLEIVGTLRSYDGEFYRVDTQFGLLTVDGAGVLCDGPGCPDLTAPRAELVILTDPLWGAGLVPALLAGFAAHEGLELSQTGELWVLRDRAAGAVAAEIRTETIDGADEPWIFLTTEGDTDLGQRRSARVLAQEAIVPFVAAQNALASITAEELTAILSGAVQNWAEIGGPDAPVHLHALAADSGFQKRVEHQLGFATSSAALRHATGADLARAVAADPYALGVTGVSVIGAGRALPLRGTCGIAQLADAFSLKTRDYPLVVPVTFFLPRHRLPATGRALVSWLASASPATIRNAGLTDLALARRGVEGQGRRLANAIAALGTEVTVTELQDLAALLARSERLSTTFRFDDGAVRLDAQSKGALSDLVAALEAGVVGPGELVFAGFSDGRGDAAANRRLAKRRADAVRSLVLQGLRLPPDALPATRVEGFGEALPLACDDTEAGRRLNRRVEVWLLRP